MASILLHNKTAYNTTLTSPERRFKTMCNVLMQMVVWSGAENFRRNKRRPWVTCASI